MNDQDSDNVISMAPKRALSQDGGGGNGGMVTYRLKELERRANKLEDKIDKMHTTLTQINTKMDEKASKSWILYWVVGTFVLAIISMVGHILIRYLTTS